MASKTIWVFPEIDGPAEKIGKISLGLLTEARNIAEKVDGEVKVLIFGDSGEGYKDILKLYGISSTYIFKHALFKHFSAEIYSIPLIERIKSEKPWLFLIGNTSSGQELVSRLAILLDTGVIANCVKMDFSNIAQPSFFSPILGEQAYQEIIFQTDRTMLVTISPGVLNITPLTTPTGVSLPESGSGSAEWEIRSKRTSIPNSGIKAPIYPVENVIEIDSTDLNNRVKHLAYLPTDIKTTNLADADVVISAGVGVIDNDLLPLVNKLAGLIEGAIGATRPVTDEGKIEKERMIGQTGKTVSPTLYLALGISGATHHIGGIQEAGTIVAINRDPQAPIFRISDAGAVADLKEVLPKLIEKIKQAKRSKP